MALPRLLAVSAAACLRLEEQLTDLALDMFDKLLGRSFRKAEQQSFDKATFEILRTDGSLPIAAAADAETYLSERQQQIEEAMAIVAARAEAGTLPDAAIQGGTLSITPVKDETPDAATAMSRLAYGQLPQIKIPDLLTEVNAWTGFAECFSHYRSGRPAEDQKALFAAVLPDGVNLSVSRMAAATHNLSGLEFIGRGQNRHSGKR